MTASNPSNRKITPLHTLMLAVVFTTILLVGTGFASLHLKPSNNAEIRRSYDVVLSNEQIQLLYTDEAAGLGSYINDTVEPRGWELYPSLYWDNNGDGVFGYDEGMATTVFPVVHFSKSGQNYGFCPLHQSVLQQPSDAEIISAGWISEPNVYASEVKDLSSLIAINSTIRIYNGNNYVTQTLTLHSLASTTLTNVSLIVYAGIDINGFFDDYAFIDASRHNMITAKDNNTGAWFGVYPTVTDAAYELSRWDDGPSPMEDLWGHCLSDTLHAQDTAQGDVEGALRFALSNINPGGTVTLTLYYSCAHQENDLYPPFINHPPYQPSNPNPNHGADNVSVDTNLSWSCGDQDGDSLTYDIYFGNASPPSQIARNWTTKTYDPGTLDDHTTYYWRIVAWDNHGARNTSTVWNFTTKTIVQCGDVNANGVIDVGDVVYLINYLFRNGPVPVPDRCSGDCNGDTFVDVGDVVYLINYLFRSGPAPGGCCT
jgi:hypothetical protein